jgi:hypothetical protein
MLAFPHDDVRDNRVELMLKDSIVEAMKLLGKGDEFTVADLRTNLGKKKFAPLVEDLLGELVKGALERCFARYGSVVSEMMDLFLAFARHERRSTPGANAIAAKARHDLRDVDDRPVGPLAIGQLDIIAAGDARQNAGRKSARRHGGTIRWLAALCNGDEANWKTSPSNLPSSVTDNQALIRSHAPH